MISSIFYILMASYSLSLLTSVVSGSTIDAVDCSVDKCNSSCKVDGLYTDDCLLSIWNDVGCTTTYPTLEPLVGIEKTYWRSLETPEQIAEDMELYFERSVTDYHYCSVCHGQKNYNCIMLHPENLRCFDTTITLAANLRVDCVDWMWKEVGCTLDYDHYYYVNLYSGILMKDALTAIIQLYTKSETQVAYCNYCHGTSSRCLNMTSSCEGVNPPLTDDCMIEVWHKVGCVTDYPKNEGATGYWRTRRADAIEIDMQKWYDRSNTTHAKYSRVYELACLGTTST